MPSCRTSLTAPSVGRRPLQQQRRHPPLRRQHRPPSPMDPSSASSTRFQPRPRPGTPLRSINNDPPEEKVHLAHHLQGLQGLGPFLHSMSTSQDPSTHRIRHRILPSTQTPLCSRPRPHRWPSSPIRRPQIPVHNHRPLNMLARSSTLGRLLCSLLCHCLPIRMGLQIRRS